MSGSAAVVLELHLNADAPECFTNANTDITGVWTINGIMLRNLNKNWVKLNIGLKADKQRLCCYVTFALDAK